MLIAVTGTDGKTTTVHMVRTILSRMRWDARTIGTLGIGHDRGWDPLPPATGRAGSLVDVVRMQGGSPEGHIGPQPPDPARDSAVVVEAPSAWLARGALTGLRPTVAAMTNVTSDHLDVHGDVRSYTRAKLRIATDLRPAAVATGGDDDGCRRLQAWARAASRRVVAVGTDVRLATTTDRARGPRSSTARCTVRGEASTARAAVTVASPAAHDRTNAATAIAVCVAAGLDVDEVLAAAHMLDLPPGRMQFVASARGADVWVDYAHTPAALAAALACLRPDAGRLVAVVGCGGDRDRTKRSRMGAVARDLADIVVVTDDNPRREDPAAIRAAVRTGCPEAVEIADRREAIAVAVACAGPGDVVAVLGRGHEVDQVGGSLAMADASIVRSLLDCDDPPDGSALVSPGDSLQARAGGLPAPQAPQSTFRSPARPMEPA